MLVAVLLGADPSQVLQLLAGSDTTGGQARIDPVPQQQGDDPAREFISVVLRSTEELWTDVFRQSNLQYQEPTLVLFSDATQGACGFAQSATGPFYCSLDNKVYLDLSFFNELSSRFGASGDFAAAYVVAHEIGHHVENQIGVLERVNQQRSRLPKSQANQLSVRLELMADCLAGVWGRHAAQNGLLEEGDIEEGMQAAAAVGDDNIQRRTSGRVRPESFTHGSSEQRVEWFRRGMESGDINACETFN